MTRPRIFLSAVSAELRSARQAVARTVRTLAYDPVSQDDFPTGHGELGQWLREQIDGCEGLEDEDFAALGGNNSATHLDFMIGSGQIDVDGLTGDGAAEPLMRRGEWAD